MVIVYMMYFIYYRMQMFDASLCGGSASEDALRCFFTHSLTHTLTYKPRLTGKDKLLTLF